MTIADFLNVIFGVIDMLPLGAKGVYESYTPLLKKENVVGTGTLPTVTQGRSRNATSLYAMHHLESGGLCSTTHLHFWGRA